MMTRVLFSDNGVLTDLSVKMSDYNQGNQLLTITAAEDYIYIGAYYPFNAKFFKMKTVATIVSSPTIEYWTGGNGWKSSVEVIDETNGFKNNGFVTMVPNKDFGWTREDTNKITALYSKVIYDLFWMRIKFSADTVIDLEWIGELFSNDYDLGAEFPDLLRTQTLDSFKTGKTDWEEQHVIAAKVIIDDMKARKIINFKEQILDRKELTLAAVQKCAALIYSSFGDDYADQKKESELEYQKRLKKDIFNIDTAESATITPNTQTFRQGYLVR